MKKKNLVAKHAKSTTSGAGPHKDRKKSMKKGETKHKKKYVENFDGGEEYNDEAGMLKTNLHTMMRACKGLHNLVSSDENLPEWAQEKVAQAKGMLVAVWDYMESQHEEGNVYTNEATKKSLKNHPWKESKAIADKNRLKSEKEKSKKSYNDKLAESLERALRKLK